MVNVLALTACSLFGMYFLTFLCHRILYGKSRRFIDALSSVLIFQWILGILLLIQAFSFTSNPLVTLILLLVAVYMLRKRVREMTASLTSPTVEFSDVIAVSLFIVFLVLILKNVFINPFPPDAFTAYLPLARIMVVEGGLPAFHLDGNLHYMVLSPLFLTLLISFLFSLTNTLTPWFAVGIPLYFSSLTFFLIWMWGKQKRGVALSMAILICLLLSPNILEYLVQVMPEPLILFYCTLAFYLISTWLDTRHHTCIVLTFLALSLFSLSKFTGIVFTGICILFLILHRLPLRILLRYGVVAFLPVIILASWNLVNYHDPFVPFFTGYLKIIGSKYNELMPVHCPAEIAYGSQEYGTFSPLTYAIWVFRDYPLLIIFLLSLFVRPRNSLKWYAGAALILFSIMNLTFLYPETRHINFLMGAIAFFCGEALLKVFEYVAPSFMNKRTLLAVVTYVLVVCLTITSFNRGGVSLFWVNVLFLILIILKIISLAPTIFEGAYKRFKKLLFVGIIVGTPILLFIVSTPGDFPAEFRISDTLSFVRNFSNPKMTETRPFPESFSWDALSYLQEYENGTIRITGRDGYLLIWYGNYTYLPLRSESLIFATGGGFTYTEDAELIHRKITQANISYIYETSDWRKKMCVQPFFDAVASDKNLFTKVLEDGGNILWHVNA